MKLTLLSKQEYTTTLLPEKIAGHYWIQGRDANGKLLNITSIDALRSEAEPDESQWIMRSNRQYKIMDESNKTLPSVVLKEAELYRIQGVNGEKYTLFAEPLSNDRRQYRAYELVNQTATIVIGRKECNHISYANGYVSGSHAELTVTAEGMILRDLNSANGTYVNGRSVQQQRLKVGDVVFILGLQIIVTNSKIFLNNPDGKVTVQCKELKEYHAPVYYNVAEDDEEEGFEDIQSEYYYRAPRFKHDIEAFELKIDAPPANQDNEELPMIMLVGPSLTMGMAAAASGTYTVLNAVGRGDLTSSIPSIIMCVSMLLGTLIWPLVTKSYQKKLRQRKEAKRQDAYTKYLSQLEKIVAQETVHQEKTLRDNDVNVEDCVKKILYSPPQIWERTPKHTDFLSLRLGLGNLPLKADIQYSERRFTVEQDNLTEMMYQFGERKHWLTNIPICLPLVERFVSGVYAPKDILFAYAKSLILRIVALHSYDEVKLVLIHDESVIDEFSFARWLPHAMNNERTIRYIATNPEEVKELSSALDFVIEYRKELNESQIKDESPYLLCSVWIRDLHPRRNACAVS